jgi:hypothetical protein
MNFTNLMAVLLAVYCITAGYIIGCISKNRKEIKGLNEKYSKLYFILQLQDKQIDSLFKIEKTLEKSNELF